MAEIKKTANPASEPAKAMKKEEKAANETAATKTKPAPKKIAKKQQRRLQIKQQRKKRLKKQLKHELKSLLWQKLKTLMKQQKAPAKPSVPLNQKQANQQLRLLRLQQTQK